MAGEKYHARIETDTAANRPAAGEANRLFVASDTDALSFDNGTSWQAVSATASFVGVTVRRTTASSALAAATFTDVTWEAADYDTSTFWTSGTDLTIPDNGKYLISFSPHYQGMNATAWSEQAVIVNGVNKFSARQDGDASLTLTGVCQTVLDLSAGDTVKFQAYQSAVGASTTLYGHATDAYATRASIAFIGA